MQNLFNIISSVITNIISVFNVVVSHLLNNELFQITIGIVILCIIIKLIFKMIIEIKNGNPNEYVVENQKKHYIKINGKKISTKNMSRKQIDEIIDNYFE